MDIFQIAKTIKKIFILVKDYLVFHNWSAIISVLKIVFLIVSILLFIGIIELIIKLNIVSRVKEAGRLLIIPRHIPKKLSKKWVKIEERLESGEETELKLAVIEADKFFDDVLKKCGYLGKDMGERLKKVSASQISNIDDIWQAHKIRNNVVHDVDYKLTAVDAEKAIKSYRKALEELEVL